MLSKKHLFGSEKRNEELKKHNNELKIIMMYYVRALFSYYA